VSDGEGVTFTFQPMANKKLRPVHAGDILKTSSPLEMISAGT
jgi:hypothetical protein